MTNGWKIALAAAVIILTTLFGLSLLDVARGSNVNATTIIQPPETDLDAYRRAIGPYEWSFPEDFGAHPEYLTEWWYYTGNVATEDGRRFGYQFTIFRRALTPPSENEIASNSEFRTNQAYLAHFTISDIAEERFFHEERFSRGGAGLAGATVDPRYRVWLEDWEILALDDEADEVRIQAEAVDFSLDVTLVARKPLTLQGANGLSPKSDEVGNASYYYSITRNATEGTIRIGDERFAVSGYSWKDHEFSTSALGANAQGWDWFGLIFDDNTEMMIGQIRLTDGGRETAFGGSITYADGTSEYLPSDAFTITPTDTWRSPRTDGVYPIAWDFVVQTGRGELRFSAEALMDDQELSDTDPIYWEGAVRVTGDKTGYGYAELTGYVESMQNRF